METKGNSKLGIKISETKKDGVRNAVLVFFCSGPTSLKLAHCIHQFAGNTVTLKMTKEHKMQKKRKNTNYGKRLRFDLHDHHTWLKQLEGYLEMNAQCYHLRLLWKPSDFFWRVNRMRYTDF
jgi:hypothetical protein